MAPTLDSLVKTVLSLNQTPPSTKNVSPTLQKSFSPHGSFIGCYLFPEFSSGSFEQFFLCRCDHTSVSILFIQTELLALDFVDLLCFYWQSATAPRALFGFRNLQRLKLLKVRLHFGFRLVSMDTVNWSWVLITHDNLDAQDKYLMDTKPFLAFLLLPGSKVKV